MDNREYLGLLNLDEKYLNVLNLYKQSRDLYNRIKVAMGRGTPSFQVSNSSNQEIKVENGTNSSTKIYTC